MAIVQVASINDINRISANNQGVNEQIYSPPFGDSYVSRASGELVFFPLQAIQSIVPASFITSVANTATVTLNVAAGVLSATAIGAPPTGTAGGDLSGTYPNPTVSKILNNSVPVNAVGFLHNDGAGTLAWQSAGTGTVTSVAVASTDLSVSGSPITTSGTITLNINNHAVTYAKMQQASTVTLLGNPTGGTANIQEITLGTGLGFSGSTLVNTAPSTVTPAALTRVNDTNVTLTLGGTPNTSLLQATSLTLGWIGQIAASRGGTGQDTSASTGIPSINSGTWSVSTNLQKGGITYQISGNGGVLTTNNWVEIICPYSGTITNFTIDSYSPIDRSAVSGSITLNVYRSGSSIIGTGNKPLLSSASTNTAAVSGWTSTTITAGDKLFIGIESVTTCTNVICLLSITKS